MEKRKKFKLPLSAYLIYLLVTIFLFSCVTFSSYITITKNSSTGRAAVFKLVVDSQEKDLVIDAEQGILTDKFDFSVTSTSEVAASYDIIIDFKAELPEGLEVKLDTQNADTTENGIYRFNNVGSFAPLDNSTHNHSLIFTATEEELAEDIQLDDLQIKVLLSQN